MPDGEHRSWPRDPSSRPSPNVGVSATGDSGARQPDRPPSVSSGRTATGRSHGGRQVWKPLRDFSSNAAIELTRDVEAPPTTTGRKQTSRYGLNDNRSMATKDPRIHHYIPQAYLRGFAWKRGEKNWHVHAWDLPGQRRFQPNTKNICCERDFLKLESGGDSPYKLESDMAKFESSARQAILHTEGTKTFEGEARNLILNFIALLAVRSPEMREHMRANYERLVKMVARVSMNHETYFDATVKKMQEDGFDIGDDFTYECMKAYIDSENYKIDVPREQHITSEFKMVGRVFNYLAMRKWKLYVLREGEGSFVTTDHPVSLTWFDRAQIPPHMRDSPGHGMKSTELIFPLTSKTLLHGRFDFEKDEVEDCGGPLAAACNSRMIASCYKYAFSVSERIPYLIPPNQVYFDDQVLLRVKEYADSRPRAEPPKEQSWSVRDGPPIPKMVDAPDEPETDWSDPKYDAIFGPRPQ